MRKLSFLVFTFLLFTLTSFAQIQSGPMVGYSEMREVLLWVQTKQAAKVKFMYWEQGNPALKMSTEEVLTQKNTAFVARLIADQVQPSKKYDYEVWIDNKLVYTKSDIASRDMIVPFAPSPNEQRINVLIETEKGEKAGLGGTVTVVGINE